MKKLKSLNFVKFKKKIDSLISSSTVQILTNGEFSVVETYHH